MKRLPAVLLGLVIITTTAAASITPASALGGCGRLVECVLWSAPRLRGLSFSLRALTSALVKSNSLHRFWISQQLEPSRSRK